MTNTKNPSLYLHPDEKKKLSKTYEQAHKVAKEFIEKHPDADATEIYKDSEVAARLWLKDDLISKNKKTDRLCIF